MFNIRTFSENQRDPIVRESQLAYDRLQSRRPRLSPTERAMARARRRNQPVAHASGHQGVSPRGRTSVEEARARAQARVAARSSAAAARFQPREAGTNPMLPPPPPPRPRRLSPAQSARLNRQSASEMARMRAAQRAQEREAARSPRRTVAEARSSAQARTVSRSMAAADRVRGTPTNVFRGRSTGRSVGRRKNSQAQAHC